MDPKGGGCESQVEKAEKQSVRNWARTVGVAHSSSHHKMERRVEVTRARWVAYKPRSGVEMRPDLGQQDE